MSAYMVDRNHIAYLIQAATSYEIVGGRNFQWYYVSPDGTTREWRELKRGDPARAVEIGQMLWDANRKSIEERYPDTVGDDAHFSRNAPGPCNETFKYHEHNPPLWAGFNPLQVIKSCDCFDYQSCEHEDWGTSEAKSFITALRNHAVEALTNKRSDLAWGAPEPLEKP